MRECYNSPERSTAIAKARGMDLVTITDHDEISGALSLADRPDVIVGCEVTGVFPDDGVKVHLNVFGIDAAQHREIQRLRHDVRELMRYLRQQQLFTSLNHVASGINGPITAPHVAALLPWVNALEIDQRLAAAGAEPHRASAWPRPPARPASPAATRTRIAASATPGRKCPARGRARSSCAGSWEGRVRVGGRQGSFFTMALRRVPVRRQPLSRAGGIASARSRSTGARTRGCFGGVLGLPLVPIALAGAYLHFVMEERFNENLLFDLVARPAPLVARMPGAGGVTCASPSSPTTTSTRSTASRRR